MLKANPQSRECFNARIAGAAFACSLAIWVASCQTAPPPVATKQPSAPPRQVTADEMARHLKERESRLADLKSFARTTVQRKGSTQTLKQALLLKDARSIRVDTLSVFGNPVGTFIHRPGSTLLYDPSADRIYRGPEVWRAIESVIGTVLDFDEYLHLFSGNIPRLESLKFISSGMKPIENDYRYFLLAEDREKPWQYRIEMNASLMPVRLEKITGTDLSYRVEWSDYHEVSGYSFPHVITLAHPQREETLTLKYQKPVINSGISDAAFQLNTGKP